MFVGVEGMEDLGADAQDWDEACVLFGEQPMDPLEAQPSEPIRLDIAPKLQKFPIERIKRIYASHQKQQPHRVNMNVIGGPPAVICSGGFSLVRVL